jgi:DNA primase catalytic core
MTATDHTAPQTLRPAWTPALAHTVGDAAADRIMADPAWPTLVAAVNHAEHADWQPDAILSVAYELLHGGHPDDEPLKPGELTTALAWRIGLLTDHATSSGNHGRADTTAPPSQTGPGTDRHGTTAHAGQGSVDDDWLASLLTDQPDDEANRDLDPDIGSDGVADHGTPFTAGREVVTDIVAQLERAEQQRHDAAAQEAHFWATAEVPRERLVELNALAEQFFTRHYTDAWAADYLRERLGTDLASDPRFTVGYAPNNWTALTRHLRRHGATDLEILAAGLGVRTALGRVIDRFRDRIVFPIKASDPDDPTVSETRGFIARRNPSRTDDDRAGPKYLNTADTDLFRKGRELYGLVDNAGALAAGATPVLVEGPLDAIAVTLSGAGAYVGIAPLGTAFTDSQADALRPHISTRTDDKSPRRAPIIVATDTDRAGQHAAHRAFWQLAARGENPHRLLIPHGKDPAELLHTDGLTALRAQLDSATPLAEQIIADRTRPYSDRLDTIEGRVYATRRAAEVIGALPPQTWPAHATALAERFGMAPATVINEILDAGHVWTLDPRGRARQRLAERLPEPAPVIPRDPSQNWAALVADLTGIDVTRLVADAHWPTLAAHLTRAATTGYDMTNRLRSLTARHPISDQHAARTLDLRLIAEWPDCLPPTGLDRLRQDRAAIEQAASHRLVAAERHTTHDHCACPRPAAPPSSVDPARSHLPERAPSKTPPLPKRQPGRSRG